MKRKILYCLCTSLFLLAGCSEKPSSPSAPDEGKDTTVITANGSATDTTTTPDVVTSATNVAKSPTFNGIIMVPPQHTATLSLTMGGKIHSLLVMPGQAVRQGQTIASLENPEFIDLQEQFLDAHAQLEYLEKEYHRQQALGNQDASSRKKVEQSKAEYRAMKSKCDAASSRLTLLGIQPASVRSNGIRPYLNIKAPISGYVVRLNANLGKYLETGQPVCDIINKSQPLIQLTVYEKDIHLMATGKEVAFRVNGLGKQTFHATITSIEQALNENDYSIKVYARIKSTLPLFRPGMYVRARIIES